MTDTELTAQTVAQYLTDHPDFFTDHAEVFATLRVPNPHSGQAISLAERQILTLRERNRALEWQLSELIHNAKTNETIAHSQARWTQRLLAEAHPALIPGAIAMGLAETFALDAVALRIWNLPGQPESAYTAPVSDTLRQFVDNLKTPICGRQTELEVVTLLPEKPASVAIIPLRLAPEEASVGVLVLGSQRAERFDPESGVAFLTSLGEMAQAALARLREPATPFTAETAG